MKQIETFEELSEAINNLYPIRNGRKKYSFIFKNNSIKSKFKVYKTNSGAYYISILDYSDKKITEINIVFSFDADKIYNIVKTIKETE